MLTTTPSYIRVHTVIDGRVSPPIPAAEAVLNVGYRLRIQDDDVVQLADLVVPGVHREFVADKRPGTWQTISIYTFLSLTSRGSSKSE